MALEWTLGRRGRLPRNPATQICMTVSVDARRHDRCSALSQIGVPSSETLEWTRDVVGCHAVQLWIAVSVVARRETSAVVYFYMADMGQVQQKWNQQCHNIEQGQGDDTENQQ